MAYAVCENTSGPELISIIESEGYNTPEILYMWETDGRINYLVHFHEEDIFSLSVSPLHLGGEISDLSDTQVASNLYTTCKGDKCCKRPRKRLFSWLTDFIHNNRDSIPHTVSADISVILNKRNDSWRNYDLTDAEFYS
jgi:hypothetical protein